MQQYNLQARTRAACRLKRPAHTGKQMSRTPAVCLPTRPFLRGARLVAAMACAVIFPVICGVVICGAVGLAQSSDRNNPTPLVRPEIRGNVVPGRSEYYAFEAGPGDVTFSLEVTSNGDYSLVLVNVYNRDFQSLVDFNGSSTEDRRERKVILSARQPVIVQLSAPRTSQSGIYKLRIGGAFKGMASLAAVPRRSDTVAPTSSGKSAEFGQGKTLNENTAVKNESAANKVESPVGASGPVTVNEINAEKRVALVIGNSAYKTSPLKNPVNDSRDMAEALRACGFEVIERENLSRRELEEQIREFGRRLSPDTVALFYYSGHGLQVKGNNYLVPVDARIEKEQDVDYEAVDVGRVMAELESAGSRLNIIILDACRDNPFARSFRSLQRGLAVVSAPSGSVIVYSTAPGMVADDGDTRNGRYTAELLKTIREPGLKLEDVLKRTRIAVREKSQGKQIPWETSSIDGDFYFVRPRNRQ